ncbi:hypothetical protein FRB90_000198 [Tulasnella sp. 427]|nr:hypothetical protein FRB90_000198 [Tulasnella sp. 427]
MFERAPSEYLVDKIVDHYGKGKDALFKVAWKSGDCTWMTRREVIRAELLVAYCDAMGVGHADMLPEGRAKDPRDLQVVVSSIGFSGLKDKLVSVWTGHSNNETFPPSRFDSINSLSMNHQLTEQELNDCYTYDAYRAVRLVAEDEGKFFSKVIPKPAGYDEWLARDGTISVADWVSEKCSSKALDVNELGRRLLKRSISRAMGPFGSSGGSRISNSARRAISFKAPTIKDRRSPTPYPRQEYQRRERFHRKPSMGGGTATTSVSGSTGVYPIPAYTYPNNSDNIYAENVRLRRELDEFKQRHDPDGENVETTSARHINDHPGVSLMGLTIEDEMDAIGENEEVMSHGEDIFEDRDD